MPGEKRAGTQRRAQGLSCERLELEGSAEAVREGLAWFFGRPILARLDMQSRGAVEIVLAEVLNNIAEHAYARYPGRIELNVTSHDGFLFVRTIDQGLPMPGNELPGGKLAATTDIQDLPEGGFGWFLIRSLTQELQYERQGDSNILTFCIDVDYLR